MGWRGSAMGQQDSVMAWRWLGLFALAVLFALAAPREEAMAQIQAHPPAPTLYDPLMLSCEVLGDPSPQEFLWQKEGTQDPLQRGPDNVLPFSSFNKTHLGTYVCTATGSLGTAVATYSLFINDLVRNVFVFPYETPTSYVRVKVKLEQPLLNFTVCLRSYSDLSRPYSLFSYATKAHDNEILLFKPKPSEYRLYVGGKFVTFRIPTSMAESEHVCASWESATGIVRFWLNRKPWPRKGLQRGYTVGAASSIVLGQEQGTLGDGFDIRQSFVGEISSVYMWDRGLATGELWGAVNDQPSPTPVFGWRNFPYEIVGDVYLKP